MSRMEFLRLGINFRLLRQAAKTGMSGLRTSYPSVASVEVIISARPPLLTMARICLCAASVAPASSGKLPSYMSFFMTTQSLSLRRTSNKIKGFTPAGAESRALFSTFEMVMICAFALKLERVCVDGLLRNRVS